jgi:hypothetical protein
MLPNFSRIEMMACAMIVFYLIGTNLPAKVPPLKMTIDEAEKYVLGIHEVLGMYPVIRPCRLEH